MSDVLEQVETAFVTEEGDHEKFAHYIDKTKLGDAYVFGTPVQAICGKMWVPTRDPEKFPVCVDCKAIYDELPDVRS